MHNIPNDSDNYDQIPYELGNLFRAAREADTVIASSEYVDDLEEGLYVIYDGLDSEDLGSSSYLLIGELSGSEMNIEEFMMLFDVRGIFNQEGAGSFVTRKEEEERSELEKLLEEREPGADVIEIEDEISEWRNPEYYQNNFSDSE